MEAILVAIRDYTLADIEQLIYSVYLIRELRDYNQRRTENDQGNSECKI
jgi:hypothetical protein